VQALVRVSGRAGQCDGVATRDRPVVATEVDTKTERQTIESGWLEVSQTKPKFEQYRRLIFSFIIYNYKKINYQVLCNAQNAGAPISKNS